MVNSRIADTNFILYTFHVRLLRHSSRGSALLIAMIILILVTLLTTVFLELIWGSAQTVQGIEASNVAYYQAVWVIEEQLIAPTVSKKTPWNIAPVVKPTPAGYTGRHLDVSTWASIMPEAGKGNSPYDDDYNIISLGNPVQIVIPPWLGNWTTVSFEFRIPLIGSGSTNISASMSASGLVLWTLGYSGASLYASGETNIFRWWDIGTPTTTLFPAFMGLTNSWSSVPISDFATNVNYLGTNWANCVNYACTLKLSMIRPILTTDNVSLPFLEYRINFWVPVPSQFMTLDATAYAYGFQRTRTIRIPQVTTNTALDFAVLQ
jgi:hypothetical protein